MNTELTLLQQQVADLWRRFKAPADTVVDDGTVARLAERVAALERQRRALLERRSALQLELGRRRSQLTGRLPAWAGLGFLAGLGVAGAALWQWPGALLPWSGLPDPGPALLLAGSLALAGLATPRAR